MCPDTPLLAFILEVLKNNDGIATKYKAYSLKMMCIVNITYPSKMNQFPIRSEPLVFSHYVLYLPICISDYFLTPHGP